MNVKPASEEAKNAVWAAYEALSEKQKRAIVKHTAKRNPKTFRYWVKKADLPRGFDQRKVVGREGPYGVKLDKALKEVEDGGLAADIFALFLMQTGVAVEVMEGVSDDADDKEMARIVDENAAASESDFATFAAATLKCYPPHRKRVLSPAEAAEKEMSGLVARLDVHAAKFEGWASALRLSGSVLGDEVSAAVEAANADVSRLAELMRGHRKTTGCPKRDFKTPDDVAAHVKELCEALVARGTSDEIADFLWLLADALRSLNVTHRSAAERTRLSDLRDGAVAEVEEVADSENPKWSHEIDKHGSDWLRWAFEIDTEVLATTQSVMKADGYERLSAFIGVGETRWISDEPSPGDDKPRANTDESGTQENGDSQTGTEVHVETSEVAGTALQGEPTEPIAEKQPPAAAETKSPMKTGEKPEKMSNLKPSAASAVEPLQITTSDDNPAATRKTASEKEEAPELRGKETVPDVGRPTAPCDEPLKGSSCEIKSIEDAAKAVLSAEAKIDVGSTRMLAAKLAAEEEYALAYHLMLYAADLGDMTGLIPAWVFGAVACGSSMQATDQSVISALQGFFQKYRESLFDELQGTDRMATRLLLAGGALEPALFSPVTGAVSILQTLHLHELPTFKELVDGVAEYGSRGVGLPRAALFSVLSADDLRRKREDVQSRAREWLLERAPRFEIISLPGKDTWRAWISKTGPVGRMLGPVVAGQTDTVTQLRALVEQFSSAGVIDQECRHLYRNELSHRGELLRPALNMIRRHTTEAINLVDEWIGLLESQPGGRQRFDQQMLTQLRRCFVDHSKKAKVELEELSGGSCPAAVRAGAKACLRVVNDLSEVLEGHGTDVSTAKACSVQRLLNDALLRVTDLRLDDDCLPRAATYSAPADAEAVLAEVAKKVLTSIADVAEKGFPTLAEAAKARGEAGDHEATAAIARMLGFDETSDTAKRAEQERTQSISRHRETAQRQLKQAQRNLSDALTKGLFDPEEYDRWAVRLGSAEKDMRSTGFVRFADIYEACDRLTHELRERKSREIARLQKDIERLTPNDMQRSRLNTVLAAGDVHTATDYLYRIQNQIEFPDETEVSPFTDFFGKGEDSACELIESELREANALGAFIDRVSKRENVAGLHLSEMQTTQAREAAEFLRLWFRVKTDRQLSETHGSDIFSYFGMHPRKMTKASDSKRGVSRMAVWELDVDPLESRDVCPFAGFGSGARGHYKVVGYWRRPAAEDILQHARELGGGPLIVLYFGRMSASERRSLAADQGHGDVIVIDDVLAVFLAGQRKGRLRSLFLCALPFAHISPYTKAASLLPPEMFYGRDREIRQLISAGTDSSCLLYGGRQIGKTVLLRHVQKLFEASSNGLNVATYIDLKGKEIGINRPMDEVWLVIAEELEKRKVISCPIGRQVKHEWLFARIEEWLSANMNRRLLVLLDEADAFLAADASGHNGKAPFSACTVLKDLMERTNRRFKLVFAGLHNVQKSTKVSNNPLAHFGEPICIGAMTDAGESQEAEALITGPLAAAGYFFESADLPARILAQTNYYPNLIQIYCDELLNYMQQRSRVLFPSDKFLTPPYKIVAKTLEDVYEQHELREELRQRFKWTLELDSRFELIANILALNDVDCAKGLDVAEIRQNAHAYWASGFSTKDGAPVSYESFRDLLEEMVGLGILRRAEPPNHYALRNPNVLNLIGSRDAVEKLLENAHKWSPLNVYDPSTFRGQISEKDKSLRSPLNAAQEAKLKSGFNQICVVCGCRAGHVGMVEEAISYRFGRDGFVRLLKGHEDRSQFQIELANLKKRKSGGTTVIVVPDHVRWDRNWIIDASKRVSQFEKAKGAVCVVFVAEPEHLLPLMSDVVRKKFDVTFITVEPWNDITVNQWLLEAGHSAVDATCRQCLAEITGNWPALLEDAMKMAKGNGETAESFRRKVMESVFRIDRKQELYGLFGLTDAALTPLRFLCENGAGWSVEEICGFCSDGESGVSLEHVTNVLTWAEYFGLARRGHDGWALDPGLQQVLSIG